MALGLGGLDQQLNDKVATFGSMPESELAKKVKLSSGLLDALAAEKVLQQKAAAARELSLSQESSPKTIVQRNEEEVLRNTQQELANQVDGTLKNKQAKRTKNMNRMAGMDPEKKRFSCSSCATKTSYGSRRYRWVSRWWIFRQT